MRTNLDKFGRVAVPKAIRDRLGWADGMQLSLAIHDGALQLKVVDDDHLLRVEGGVLIYGGEPTADLKDAVQRSRQERIHRLGNGRR